MFCAQHLRMFVIKCVYSALTLRLHLVDESTLPIIICYFHPPLMCSRTLWRTELRNDNKNMRAWQRQQRKHIDILKGLNDCSQYDLAGKHTGDEMLTVMNLQCQNSFKYLPFQVVRFVNTCVNQRFSAPRGFHLRLFVAKNSQVLSYIDYLILLRCTVWGLKMYLV